MIRAWLKKIKPSPAWRRQVQLMGISLLAILLAVAITSFIILCTKPTIIEPSTPPTTIKQVLEYDYTADVVPCILYPEGGTVEPFGDIITKITNQLNISLEAVVTADTPDTPIDVEGMVIIAAQVLAEDLWSSNEMVVSETPIEYDKETGTILKANYTFNINDIQAIIEAIEEETEASPRGYWLKIMPTIEGVVLTENEEVPLNLSNELAFEYRNSTISLQEEMELTYTDEQTVNVLQPIPATTPFLKNEILVTTARNIMAVICVLLIVFLGLILYKQLKPQRTIVEKTDKRAKAQLIEVNHLTHSPNAQQIVVNEFNDLLRIADESERPIFKTQQDKQIQYSVLEQNYTYTYLIDKKQASEEDAKYLEKKRA